MRALVAGSGSIGRRHMRNLRILGIKDIAAADPDPERMQPMVEELGITPFTDFDAALRDFKPDVVLVCSPPVHHVAQARAALEHGAHTFIEKPLSNTLDGCFELAQFAKQTGLHVQMGYNMRYNPGVALLKQLVDSGELGKVQWARAEFAQYLPEWRPWQDYRQNYTARRDLGGGIILDASHEIDYVMWMLGKPKQVMCMSGKVSDLEVSVEDSATLLIRFESGAQADIHLDFVQRKASRSVKIAFSEGTAEWDYHADEVKVHKPGEKEPEHRPYVFEPNDMYLSEMRDFLRSCEGSPSQDSLCEGIAVLEVALKAKEVANG